jgi:hypothetical protein
MVGVHWPSLLLFLSHVVCFGSFASVLCSLTVCHFALVSDDVDLESVDVTSIFFDVEDNHDTDGTEAPSTELDVPAAPFNARAWHLSGRKLLGDVVLVWRDTPSARMRIQHEAQLSKYESPVEEPKVVTSESPDLRLLKAVSESKVIHESQGESGSGDIGSNGNVGGVHFVSPLHQPGGPYYTPPAAEIAVTTGATVTAETSVQDNIPSAIVDGKTFEAFHDINAEYSSSDSSDDSSSGFSCFSSSDDEWMGVVEPREVKFSGPHNSRFFSRTVGAVGARTSRWSYTRAVARRGSLHTPLRLRPEALMLSSHPNRGRSPGSPTPLEGSVPNWDVLEGSKGESKDMGAHIVSPLHLPGGPFYQPKAMAHTDVLAAVKPRLGVLSLHPTAIPFSWQSPSLGALSGQDSSESKAAQVHNAAGNVGQAVSQSPRLTSVTPSITARRWRLLKLSQTIRTRGVASAAYLAQKLVFTLLKL